MRLEVPDCRENKEESNGQLRVENVKKRKMVSLDFPQGPPLPKFQPRSLYAAPRYT